MMRSRRQRFERLLALRERELEERRTESARARAALRETRLALEIAHAAFRAAVESARARDGEDRRVDEWTERSDWMQSKAKDVEKALETHDLARQRERVTTSMVQKAEREKRKIEKLLVRIREEEMRLAIVRDQKETDEVAARKSLARSLDGEPAPDPGS